MKLLVLGGVISAMIPATLAFAVTADTPTVKGRAPQITSVTSSDQTVPGGTTPVVTHTMTAGYAFADADADADVGTVVQWLNGTTSAVIASGLNYVPVVGDMDTGLKIQVIPKTDAALSDPSVGSTFTSALLPVLFDLPVFKPDNIVRTWAEANDYCQSLGGRLPTQDELRQLYVDATSATNYYERNNEMCEKYGWPLAGACGANPQYTLLAEYWTTFSYTVSGVPYHGAVNMADPSGGGGIRDGAPLPSGFYTVCFR